MGNVVKKDLEYSLGYMSGNFLKIKILKEHNVKNFVLQTLTICLLLANIH